MIVTRDPIERAYSAWKDKFRFQQVNADLEDHRVKVYTETYFNKFEPLLRPFMDTEDDIVNFESFAKMLIENPGEEKHNNHWKSQYYICHVCQIKFDYIIHMEDSGPEISRIMEFLKLSKLPSKEEYYANNTRTTKNHNENTFKDSDTSSYIIKELYRRFFFDFLVLGYSPSIVTDKIN